MADNVKISELDALTAAQNSTTVPVVDGGTTKKMSLSTLQTHLTASFATPSQLSTQISNVNSTISALTTSDISEGTNQYYTNARVDARLEDLGAITSSAGIDALQIQNLTAAVKPVLNANDVISGSITTSSIADFPTEVSRSAAEAGFGAGGGGGAGDIEGVTAGLGIGGGGTTGTVTVSLDTGSTHFTTGVSASAAAAGFGASGGGGGTDYISNITLSNSTLTFTGQGSAFNNTINLAVGGGDGGNLLTTDDAGNFVGLSTYETDSGSFATRLDSAGGGGGSVPTGTVSSSAQVISNLGGSGVVSSSAQITVANADLTGLTIDDIGNGTINKYYSDSLVLTYINSRQVLSGSAAGGFDVAGTDIVSSSTQIENLGFVSAQTFGQGTASLQSQIDGLEGISANDQNTFLAIQFFEQDIIVTGSVRIESGSGFFSGSGEKLYNIPASAIVGGLELSGSSIADGTNTLAVDYSTGINATINAGTFNVLGADLIVSGGVFSGSGAGLYDIPGDAIIGGVAGGNKISSASFSASITDNGEFLVGPNSIFEGNIYSSGSITATEITVGLSGTPTLYSSTNLNLSASNAVVITDSPLRLNPFTNTETGSFSLSNGDLVYNSTDNDFYGYKNGSWVSLTGGAGDGVNWGQIAGKPNGLFSSSLQVPELGGGLLSSSAQVVSNTGTGDVLFSNALGVITSSAAFRYTEGTETLTSPTMSVGVLAYSSLSGPAAATGSFNLVDADRLVINNAVEFPTSDGTTNQILKTDGAGNIGFATVETLITSTDITTTGIITVGTGSVIGTGSISLDDNLTVQGTINNQTIGSGNTVIESNNIRLQSGGQLLLSSSNADLGVVIDDVLVIPERDSKPTTPRTGSIIVSASVSGPRPYFYDGTAWFPMFT
jgi:hypothetical protein